MCRFSRLTNVFTQTVLLAKSDAPEFSPNSFPGLSPTRPTGNEVEFSLTEGLL